MKHFYWLLAITILAVACNKDKPAPSSGAEQEQPQQGQPEPGEPGGEKEPEDPYKDYTTYIIQKGKNYCEGNTYEVLSAVAALDFLVVFDSSCIYQNADPVNQADINKLLGFSDCVTHHQQNSARFGWNWMDGALNLYAYCYRNGERMHKPLGSISLDTAQHLKMYVEGNYYLFVVNGKIDTMPRYCEGNSINGYSLLPYFGGDEPAPQDIHIRIRRL